MRKLGPAEAEAFSRLGHAALASLEALAVPTIAAVNGFALGGGCELALACDFNVAPERAACGQPEVNLGIVPGFGGTQRLTRLVGKGMALELCTTGRQVRADEALRIGLANHVVPAGELLAKGLELAQMIATKGPLAVRLGKHLVQRGQDMDLANANAFEADAFGVVFASDDRREGMAAFLDKRKPAFTGR
jgi:enoyl-CoA hydratase